MCQLRKLKVLILTSTILFSPYVFADTASDSEITQSIEAKIAADPSSSAAHIKVDTQNGVVTILGVVESKTQASKIVELAESTDGVKNVATDQLAVKGSKQPLTDTFITSKVKGVFIREKLFTDSEVAAMSITVETKNGVVYLSGTADNQDQIKKAVSLAKSVDGVKNVKSTVKIKKD